jgi:hypothetical protein
MSYTTHVMFDVSIGVTFIEGLARAPSIDYWHHLAFYRLLALSGTGGSNPGEISARS